MNEAPLLHGRPRRAHDGDGHLHPFAPPGVNPTWTVQVQVDFVPSLGFFKNIMPAGTAPGTVRYRATSVATP